MNTTAGFVWERLAQPSTVKEIGAALTREFMVALQEATVDAAHLIQQLVDEGCVLVVSPSEPAPLPDSEATGGETGRGPE